MIKRDSAQKLKVGLELNLGEAQACRAQNFRLDPSPVPFILGPKNEPQLEKVCAINLTPVVVVS